MRIKYTGSATVRTIMQYRWDKANGYVCDVPDALAANLLTYPRPEFELVETNVRAAEARIERSLSETPPRTNARPASRFRSRRGEDEENG